MHIRIIPNPRPHMKRENEVDEGLEDTAEEVYAIELLKKVYAPIDRSATKERKLLLLKKNCNEKAASVGNKLPKSTTKRSYY